MLDRCVSLYGLQEEYMHGMGLEDIFVFLSENGITNIEILPDQMLHNTPHMSPKAVCEWLARLERYSLVPVCADIFLNTNLYLNRTLRHRECVELLADELAQAKALGFTMVRLANNVPADLLEDLLPHAERFGITVARELTAGSSFETEDTRAFSAEVRRLNSPLLGLVVDTGMFCRRPPRVFTEYCRWHGASNDLIEYVEALYANGGDLLTLCEEKGGLPAELTRLVATKGDELYLGTLPQYGNQALEVMDEHLPYIKHFHMKCYEVCDEGVEYSIDDKAIVSYLKESGFCGYLSTEYEGSRWALPGAPIPEKEQVLRHQQMLSALLGVTKKGAEYV